MDQSNLPSVRDHIPAASSGLPLKIGFLALAPAHQHLHWIPVALELARRGADVDVLCPSRSGMRLIRSFDPEASLRLRWIPGKLGGSLFDLPPRFEIYLLYSWLFRRYPVLVTTETTSSILMLSRKFKSLLVRIRHGAGDAATRIDDRRVRLFDLNLVGGEKYRKRLLEAGLGTEENLVVAGYAKFELVKPPAPLFPDDRPIALYNPHVRRDLSSWFTMGRRLVHEMEQIEGWNFVVAPHVKLRGGPRIRSSAPNVLIDRGSVRSIDMSYTQAASVYVGDASSQVYEFLRTPRPCIFINAHGVDWRGREDYAHFALGQVIERPEELGPALARSAEMQPHFEPLQRAAMAGSIEQGDRPASQRQADAILDFIAKRSTKH